MDCEKNTRLLSRRTLVAKFKIYKGEKITRLNVIPKRPSTGIPPSKMKLILGKFAKKNISKDQKIELSDLS